MSGLVDLSTVEKDASQVITSDADLNSRDLGAADSALQAGAVGVIPPYNMLLKSSREATIVGIE